MPNLFAKLFPHLKHVLRRVKVLAHKRENDVLTEADDPDKVER